MNYEILSTELALPAYSAMTDAAAAADLNVVDISQVKSSMSGSDIWAATDSTEYIALTDAKKARWLSFCAIDSHDPSVGGLAQLFVVNMFGGGSTTVTTLGTLRTDTISRAAELGLKSPNADHIAYARSL